MSRGGPGAWLNSVVRTLLSEEDAKRLSEALDEEYDSYQHPRLGRWRADLWYVGQVARSVPVLWQASARRAGSTRLDLRALLRRLQRSRVSALATAVTLALTLGAGTSILAVVGEVVLTPPPFEDPAAVVTLEVAPLDEVRAVRRTVSRDLLAVWSEHTVGVARLEGYDPTNVTITGLGPAERVTATRATPGFLPLLGVGPERGRLFVPTDEGRAVAVVSHGFWQGRMGSDPAAVGRALVLGGQPHEVIGVLPEEFHFSLNATDVWLTAPSTGPGADGPFRPVARLETGVTPTHLLAALEQASAGSTPGLRVRATSISAAIVGGTGWTLGLLTGAAGLALMVAFTNLVVLLMVRSLDRRAEMAIRRALGAPRSDARRQLVLESTALVMAGLAGGTMLATWATPILGRYALEFGGLESRTLSVDGSVLASVAVAAVVCAFVCGVVAARTGDGSLRATLRSTATASTGELRLRRLLVAGEVALAFVLVVSLTTAGVALADLTRADPGFDPRGVTKLQVSLPQARYPTDATITALQRELVAGLRDRLGSVSLIDELPLTGDRGRRAVSGARGIAELEAVVRSAGVDYFRVMGIPVLSGRGLDDDDPVPSAVVVSESLARSVFGSGDPIGRSLWLDGDSAPGRIVGVVGDVKHASLDEMALPTVYRAAHADPSRSVVLVIRSTHPETEVVGVVRAVMQELDPLLPVYGVLPMPDVVAMSPGMPSRRLVTVALAGFALLALALSAIGLFGVAAHDAARRRDELSLRVALGAGPARLLGDTLARDTMTVAAGLSIGALLVIPVLPVVDPWLPVDGWAGRLTIGVAAALVVSIIAVVGLLPVAIRVTRRDSGLLIRGL